MNLLRFLEEIPDPRQDTKVQHDLSAILFTTICSVLCGAQSWHDVALFARCKKGWLSKYVNLGEKLPSLWTFRRIFTLIKPDCLEYLLQSHAASIMGKDLPDHIAIDGKFAKSSKSDSVRCLKSLTAWCKEKGIVLAQKRIEDSSNETATIPFLIDILDLKGATVTVDAAGCYKNIAQGIRDQKGHYVLALKRNQRKLYEAVEKHIQETGYKHELKLYDKFDDSHGRLVRRRCFAYDIASIDGIEEWKDLKTAIAIETISSSKKKKVSANWRYYVSSHESSNEKIPSYIRDHWSIENSLHWILDVHLQEDNDTKVERKSARAFSVLKRMALNIVRSKRGQEKGSLKGKLKQAGWNEEYLLKLLL